MSKIVQSSMKKWPFEWMATYGSETSFLLIFSARDDLVKVSWKFMKIGCWEVPKPSYPVTSLTLTSWMKGTSSFIQRTLNDRTTHFRKTLTLNSCIRLLLYVCVTQKSKLGRSYGRKTCNACIACNACPACHACKACNACNACHACHARHARHACNASDAS